MCEHNDEWVCLPYLETRSGLKGNVGILHFMLGASRMKQCFTAQVPNIKLEKPLILLRRKLYDYY